MPFKKGQSGNPLGRPKSIKTKMKSKLEGLIDKGLEKIQSDIETAAPEERQRLVMSLTKAIRTNAQ